jgi:hypothetical protein
MTQVDRQNVTSLHSLPGRARLTTTHPHGSLVRRRDGSLALLRISKNASTELMNRLDCRDWVQFAENDAPVVLFLRDPVRRFVSSVPETLLRVQHPAIEDPQTLDRVVISEDVYAALEAVMDGPIEALIDRFLDLIEEAPFDAHHEPQLSFFTGRDGALRIDGRVFTVENIEDGLQKIALRYGITLRDGQTRFNVGGAKPLEGSTPFRMFARKITRTGLYRRLPHSPLLAGRYIETPRTLRRHELNAMANRFAAEFKEQGLTADQTARVRALYHADIALWSRVRESSDRLLSEMF